MELSLKSKTIKKKHKKKKIRVPESALLPVIKPELKNGESNWMKLLKVVGPVNGERSKRDAKSKMIGSSASSLNATKDSKPTYSHIVSRKKVPLENIKSKGLQSANFEESVVEMKDDIIHNDYDDTVHEHLVKSSDKDQNASFKFSFNERNNSSTINNDEESKRYEAFFPNGSKKLTKAVAMDCEMVGTGPKGEESIIARVSIVNSYGDCLYDEFVKPKEKVTDFRTKISGVRPSNLKNGKDLFEVQKDVLSIIEGRILVGHSIKHDLDVLFISHPKHLIRDTAFYKPFREICGGKTPSLKKLTSKILGCDIQSGEHSSVEDAQATMLLYLRQRREWESFVKSQRKRKPKMIENHQTLD